MKKYLLIILVFASSINLFAQFEDLHFGTDSTLDIVTWNIEHFPKNGQTTLNYVTQIVEALDVDVLAIQEVEDYDMFAQLIENLSGWEGEYAYDQYAALAYLYKSDVIENVELFEIYPNFSREFPRAPFVMEMTYQGEDFVIMNNHLKCCGDGTLNTNDDYDEEKRRLDACNLINDYIVNNYNDKRVIVLGDLNDILTDSPSNNVFQTFIDNPESYLFADMDIAQGSIADWSYPSWPSHLDHILITNESFGDFQNDASSIQTIHLDDYFSGGFSDYDYNVSDHRPVGLKVKVSSTLGIDADLAIYSQLTNFPNPIINNTTITFKSAKTNTKVIICNIYNQNIEEFQINEGQKSVIGNTSKHSAGLYYCKLIENNNVISIHKMIVN